MNNSINNEDNPFAGRTLVHRSKKERGFFLIWTTIALVAICGISALSVDASYFYERRAEAQRVADCAALTYAYTISTQGTAAATTAMDTIMTDANYNPSDTTNNYVTSSYQGNPFWYHVHVGRPELGVFSPAVGVGQQTINAGATAEFIQPVQMGMDPLYFGVANSSIPVVLQVNGPTDDMDEGDNYSSTDLSPTYANTSPLYYATGTPNPNNAGWTGYLFQVTVPSTYKATWGNTVEFQIYDPEYYDYSSNDTTEWPDLDVIRDDGNGDTADNSSITYTLENSQYQTLGTPATYTEPYSPSNHNDKNVWVTPFTATVNSTGSTTFYIRIQTTAGPSQNGFLLRAGPPVSDLNTSPTMATFSGSPNALADTLATSDAIYSTSWYINNNAGKTYTANPTGAGGYFSTTEGRVTWHQAYADFGQSQNTATSIAETDTPPSQSPDYTGIGVTAVGKLPIIFTNNGSDTMILGTVPTESTQVSITKFDAGDEGTTTKALYYECSTITDTSQSDGLKHYTGTLTTDDQSTTDTITLPSTYTGGVWTAHYTSSVMDMSTWVFNYVGPPTGTGTVGLISTGATSLY